MQIYHGSYTGNGSSGRAITGVGFAPDMVLIRRIGSTDLGDVPVYWANTSMSAGYSTTLRSDLAFATGFINSIDSDGFTISNHAHVNYNGDSYYYLAIRDNGAKDFKTGVYTGNGSDGLAITGLGFQPDFVLVHSNSNIVGSCTYSCCTLTNKGFQMWGGVNRADLFASLDSDGFTVNNGSADSANLINVNATTHAYFAFKAVPGKVSVQEWTGNSTDNRDISLTDTALTPVFALAKGGDVTAAFAMRMKQNSGDQTQQIDNSVIWTNCIQSFGAGTFQVGSDSRVNVTAYKYSGLFIADNFTSPVIDQEGFAFGDDDGSESAHTLGTQDANLTEALGTKTLRLLLNSSGDPASAAFKLKYQKNGTGGYADVLVGSTSNGQTGAIEATDITESGNNTASGSWAVSYPAASTGDLLIFNIAWDDSTNTTTLTAPSGPNGETAVVISDVTASANTACRGKVVYYIATGSWSASTLTFTPGASEQWTAAVIKVPAGEFNASSPIGATNTNPSTGTTDPLATPSLSVGSDEGGGRVVAFFAVDAEDPDGSMTGWTMRADRDRGAVGLGIYTRDDLATASESISEATGLTKPTNVDWVSFAYVVKPPIITNQVYISASANVTASGEATTARLTAPSGKTTSDFDTGRRWDDENGTDSIDITETDYTELEWVLTTQSPAADTDYFDFRVYKGDTALDSYTVTPRWTIASGTNTTNFFLFF